MRNESAYCKTKENRRRRRATSECLYNSLPPCQRRFQNRFRVFFPYSYFVLLVRPVHLDVFVNASLSCILFFNLAAFSGKYSLLPVSCNRRSGGGYRRNSLPSLPPDVGTRLVYISDLYFTRLMASFLMRACTSEPTSPQVDIARGRRE